MHSFRVAKILRLAEDAAVFTAAGAVSIALGAVVSRICVAPPPSAPSGPPVAPPKRC
jgi:hypothetical protein